MALWLLCAAAAALPAARCAEATAHVVVACDSAQFPGLGAVLRSAVASASTPGLLAFTAVVPAAELGRAEALVACAVGDSGAGARVVAVETTGVARLAVPTYADFARAAGSSNGLRDKFSKYGELGSRLNYARFFLDELLPRDAAFALYVDVDAVVLCDVVSLLSNEVPALEARFPDRGGAVAAVDRDGPPASSKKKKQEAPARRRRLFKRSGPAFNAGVFVADVARWRASRATALLEAAMAEAYAAVRSNGTAPWSRPSSQAPMVHVFGAAFLPLDPRWNRLFHDSDRRAAPADVEALLAKAPRRTAPDEATSDCVWHFTGAKKPWDQAADHWTRRLWDPYAAACGGDGGGS